MRLREMDNICYILRVDSVSPMNGSANFMRRSSRPLAFRSPGDRPVLLHKTICARSTDCFDYLLKARDVSVLWSLVLKLNAHDVPNAFRTRSTISLTRVQHSAEKRKEGRLYKIAFWKRFSLVKYANHSKAAIWAQWDISASLLGPKS